MLVSLSTTYQAQGDLLRRLVQALDTLPAYALITTGPAIEPESLAPSPRLTIEPKVGRNARAGTLRSAMHRVLSEPAFRAAARRVAAGIAGDDDDSAPQEIEAVVTHADAHASVRS